MTLRARVRAAAIVLLAAGAVRPGLAAELSCAQAARIAEAREAIPAGLLSAIGAVESGRSAGAGPRAPWPWTVQAAGAGRFLASADAARATVLELQSAGVRSIDIGCFQINLAQHPDAFADLASGLAPLPNAFAAARFLRALHTEFGRWDAAVAAYHSRTGALGGPYRDQVFAAWHPAADGALPVRAESRAASGGARVSVWGPGGRLWPGATLAAAALPRVITPASP